MIVDLATGRPSGDGEVGPQHPERRPQALRAGDLDARLDVAVREVETRSTCSKPRGTCTGHGPPGQAEPAVTSLRASITRLPRAVGVEALLLFRVVLELVVDGPARCRPSTLPASGLVPAATVELVAEDQVGGREGDVRRQLPAVRSGCHPCRTPRTHTSSSRNRSTAPCRTCVRTGRCR